MGRCKKQRTYHRQEVFQLAFAGKGRCYGLYAKALANRESRTFDCTAVDEIKAVLAEKGDCFIRAMWCGDEACEDAIKEQTGVGSRCIPLDQKIVGEKCACCGKEAKHMVLWAKAY